MRKKKPGDIFHHTFAKNKKLLIAIAYDLIKDTTKTDDILQDVYLSAGKHWEKIAALPVEQQISYLCAVTRNKAISLYRQNKTEEKKAKAYGNISPQHTASSPEEIIISRENLAEAKKYILELDEDFRIVLELSVFFQLTDEEISQQLGISVNLVRVRKHRAREKLKAKIKEVNRSEY